MKRMLWFGLMIAGVLILVKNGVDYVFVGSKESGYLFAVAIEGQPNIRPVYDRDGVKIYKVDAP
ncbi:MAG TPA: hypothetical protein VGJ92_05205 [Methanocella sp.]